MPRVDLFLNFEGFEMTSINFVQFGKISKLQHGLRWACSAPVLNRHCSSTLRIFCSA